jgi:hypothetical protein
VRDFDLAYVRFGSSADKAPPLDFVRFTPKSGHSFSLSEELRQPRDVDRDPPRLVKGQLLAHRSAIFAGPATSAVQKIAIDAVVPQNRRSWRRRQKTA